MAIAGTLANRHQARGRRHGLLTILSRSGRITRLAKLFAVVSSFAATAFLGYELSGLFAFLTW